MEHESLTVADPGISERGGGVRSSMIVLMPFTYTPYAFAVRVENEIHVVDIAC